MNVRVCVVGGGINGSGIAWELVRRGYDVTLFERGRFGGATSSATTKMIHGGLRYLETGNVRLVRESLAERAFLLDALPDLVRPLPIAIPIYGDAPRSPLVVRSGLLLYDLLAGSRRIEWSRRLGRAELLRNVDLEPDDLRSALLYHDAQVDDAALVRRVIDVARRDGARAFDDTPVDLVEREAGTWRVGHSTDAARQGTFDVLVNAVGPWMNEHLERFRLSSRWHLTLIRGSHIILNRPAPGLGTLLQSDDGRVLFVLPWKGKMLVGTTEEPHDTTLASVTASDAEIRYLLERFNRYFARKASESEIESTFAGVRPLIESKANPSRISREARVETGDGMVNVFGGKLTTFMALARTVARAIDRMTGNKVFPSPPVF